MTGRGATRTLRRWTTLAALAAMAASCAPEETAPPAAAPRVVAFTGARLILGTGTVIGNAALLVRDGRVAAAGPLNDVAIPPGAVRVDASGRTIVPGFVNAHGHVGGTRGLRSGAAEYTRGNVLDQLALYARYGVTTVLSLGDDREEGVRVRDEESSPDLSRARLLLSGPVLAPSSPDEVPALVDGLVAMRVDWVKIRVDDALGTQAKMPPAVYARVMEEAHRRGLRVAVHIVTLEDAKGVLRAGADFIAHSVRDLPVDDELIGLLRERDVCVSPTLTRELSTFVYAARPSFFDDPFFAREADPAVIAELESDVRQQAVRSNAGARYYERQLPVARGNLKALRDAGVRIAFGTDSGPPARFQGYFEHLEMAMMADAGLTPAQILESATRDAAGCIGASEVGTLEPGRRADFIVLGGNPLEDLRHARAIESVWIAGNRVPARDAAPARTQ